MQQTSSHRRIPSNAGKLELGWTESDQFPSELCVHWGMWLLRQSVVCFLSGQCSSCFWSYCGYHLEKLGYDFFFDLAPLWRKTGLLLCWFMSSHCYLVYLEKKRKQPSRERTWGLSSEYRTKRGATLEIEAHWDNVNAEERLMGHIWLPKSCSYILLYVKTCDSSKYNYE